MYIKNKCAVQNAPHITDALTSPITTQYKVCTSWLIDCHLESALLIKSVPMDTIKVQVLHKNCVKLNN